MSYEFGERLSPVTPETLAPTGGLLRAHVGWEGIPWNCGCGVLLADWSEPY